MGKKGDLQRGEDGERRWAILLGQIHWLLAPDAQPLCLYHISRCPGAHLTPGTLEMLSWFLKAFFLHIPSKM